MPYSANVFQVVIASPGDVIEERELAVQAVHEWNALNSRTTSIALLPARWETHSAPVMGDRGQGVINRQFLDDSDLLVGIFWTRLGTPTGVAESGTVEEIERHTGAEKPAMLYFSDAPVVPSSIDHEQYEQLQEFRRECEGSGLLRTYESAEEFGTLFRQHLTIIINTHDYFSAREGEAREVRLTDLLRIPADTDPAAGLSEEARALLIEGAADQSGTIMRLRMLGGTRVQTNGKQFVEPGDPRSEATWEDAVASLHSRGLIRDRGVKGEIFSLTSAGYELAGQLTQSAEE